MQNLFFVKLALLLLGTGRAAQGFAIPTQPAPDAPMGDELAGPIAEKAAVSQAELALPRPLAPTNSVEPEDGGAPPVIYTTRYTTYT